MACSQRPGPRAAITYINDACGIHLTQADWHHLRSLAEHHLGHRLSTSYADAEEVQRVANDLIDKYEGTAAQKAEFVRGFTRARNTEGTVDVVAAIVAHDTLNQLEERPRRTSRQQRERNGENETMNTTAVETFPGDDEFGTWVVATGPLDEQWTSANAGNWDEPYTMTRGEARAQAMEFVREVYDNVRDVKMTGDRVTFTAEQEVDDEPETVKVMLSLSNELLER